MLQEQHRLPHDTPVIPGYDVDPGHCGLPRLTGWCPLANSLVLREDQNSAPVLRVDDEAWSTIRYPVALVLQGAEVLA